jgi:hypothetical protein
MDKAQKPSNSESYTPSSEPFRIYKNISVHQISLVSRRFVYCCVLASCKVGISHPHPPKRRLELIPKIAENFDVHIYKHCVMNCRRSFLSNLNTRSEALPFVKWACRGAQVVDGSRNLCVFVGVSCLLVCFILPWLLVAPEIRIYVGRFWKVLTML